jgi:glutamate transport system substrate-binding protein
VKNKIALVLAAALLIGTGLHGLIWLTLLLVAQGLDRAEKILSAVSIPATIAIGCAGLWLTWLSLWRGNGATVSSSNRLFGLSGAPRVWAAIMVALSVGANLALVRVYLPNRLPDLGYVVRIGVSGLHPRWSKANIGQEIGSATGFDMELVNYLRQRFTGNKWIVVQVTPAEREEKIVTGEVDLVIANYSIEGTSVAYGEMGVQRRAVIKFAGPYFLDTSGIMRNPSKVNGGESVPPEKLCISKGTTAEDYIQSSNPDDRRKMQSREQEECFNRMIDPEDDAVYATVTDNMILKARAASMGTAVPVLPQPDRDGLVRTEKYGIGLPNRHSKLCDELNAAIGDFIEEGDGGSEWNAAWKRHLADLGEEPDPHRPQRPPSRCNDAA